MLQVMVVEKDPAVGSLYHEELEDAGFEVRVAKGLEEALQWLRGQPVDVVITDQASCERPMKWWLPELRQLHNGPVVLLSPRACLESSTEDLWEVPKTSDVSCLITSLRSRTASRTGFSGKRIGRS
jgi:DNA-binding response OmpR family regulator